MMTSTIPIPPPLPSEFLTMGLRRLFLAGLLLPFSFVACAAVTNNDTQPLPTSLPPLSPTASEARVEQAVAGLLSQYHYRRIKLDDALSSAAFDDYLAALDFSRSYFLASDVADFEKYRTKLDDDLRNGRLGAAFEIYNRYQQRLLERTQHAREVLSHPFDFSVRESIELDRKKAPWATTTAELDEIWRKRLKHETLNLMLAGKDETAARETLRRRYEGRLRRAGQAEPEDVFQAYMNAITGVFDPHTSYLSPRSSENFNIQMRLSLEGIGAVLRLEDEETVVVELVPGGPADMSKLIKPKDRIVAVGQGDDSAMTDVVGWRLDDVVDLIRGQRGSVVRLQVVPAADPPGSAGALVRLVRNKIQLEEQAAKSQIKTFMRDGVEQHIGVITIPTFYIDFAAAQRGDADYRSTTRDVRRLLHELEQQKVDGVVIDLRQNGGGSLQEAVELTGLFIAEGPVVQVRDSKGKVQLENDPDPDLVYGGPLAVLTDRFSASASEIFAGAIQDYGRGLIIGEPTFGKGTVQTLIELGRFLPQIKDKLGQLKLTIAKFYRVNGSSTQHRGVHPDIGFPVAFGEDEVGEGAQEHAMPWDEIAATRYKLFGHVNDMVPELMNLHDSRVAHDQAYQDLKQDLEYARELRKRTRVSLLESERRAEHDAARARLKSRAGRAQLDGDSDGGEDTPRKDGPDPFLDEATRVLGDFVALRGSGR